MKAVVKKIVPAWLWWFFRGLWGWRWFEGNFRTWAEAQAASSGYDDDSIVRRVLAATMDVREGRAAFERDGVTFATYVAEPGLLGAFGRIAQEAGSIGSVLDFGGALGTTYWRHRSRWKKFGLERWDVVEQPVFVRAAKEVATDELAFFAEIEAAERERHHRVLLSSGSLQYLPDPTARLRQWMAGGFDWIVLNNLPLKHRGPDRIALQRVPPEIYAASYPVWFFNREKFLRQFGGRYEVVMEFSSEAEWQVGLRRFASTGLLLKKRTHA
jgi:hypothetical protein